MKKTIVLLLLISFFNPVFCYANDGLKIIDKDLGGKLKGRIIIKPEDEGKAYYVNSDASEMFYLGRPSDAFEIMRREGVGISNQDLLKIPVGNLSGGIDSDNDGLSDMMEDALGLDPQKRDTDGDGYFDADEVFNGYNPNGIGKLVYDTVFTKAKLLGKIFLQVEDKGQAWYVNPADAKRYFLGRPGDAFQVMRELALGISNENFDKLYNNEQENNERFSFLIVSNDCSAFSNIEYSNDGEEFDVECAKFDPENFEDRLTDSLSGESGPNLIALPNTWIKKYQDFLIPADSYNSINVRDEFVPVVYDDVVLADDANTKVYGLPLSVDTLALYYNIDLLEAAQEKVPEYWNHQMTVSVKNLTVSDNNGVIIQSGLGIGGENIMFAGDIMSLLMMQNGTQMVDSNGVVTFNKSVMSSDFYPGVDAVRFYTDFSNPSKEIYTWEDSLGNSLDRFKMGDLAMMFGYSDLVKELEEIPQLNFDIAKVPNIEGSRSKSFANYLVYVVPHNAPYPDKSWNFLKYLAAGEGAEKYLEISQNPPALRRLVERRLEKDESDVFAEQALTADSWYRGYDPASVENVMLDMIRNYNSDEKTLKEAVDAAAETLSETYNKK